MDTLPDNIKRIDVLRIEYGKRKLCQCHNPHYEIDYQNRLVYCSDCGAIVDAFEAIAEMARYYERLGDQVENLLEQRRQISGYKPHLVVIKDLEKHYRKSMVPCCPRCNRPFDLAEIECWSNRAFLNATKMDGGEKEDD